MTLSWVGTPVINGSPSGTTASVNRPTVANGQVLVMGLRAQGTVATEVTLPSGFLRAGSPQGAADRAQGLFYKIVTDASSEPASYSISGYSTGRADIWIQALAGVDTTNPIDGYPPYSTGDLAGYTAGVAPYMKVVMWGDERTTPRSHVPTGPAGYSTLVNFQNTLDSSTAGSRTAVWAGYELVPTGGATAVDPAALVWPDGVSANRAVGVAFRGIADPVTPKRGFVSVPQMLRTPGATWAHRLGSANWAEMSRNGALQSSAAGYGALEFSAQRSSNGWWFGMHDNDFNRTSQTTGSPAPGTLTQAQILATYVNSLKASGTPEAYWGLTNFLDQYTPTHVAIVDPKNQLGFIPEFLDLLDAHGGNTKIVVKYSGVGGGSANLADLAKARHYETWGYFYEADVANGNIAAWQSHWSILGMEYGASQASWDFIKSFGKPVVAHIAPNQAAYNQGIARGADMVQVSGVASVAAVGASLNIQPWSGVYGGGVLAQAAYVGTEKVWP